MSDRRCAAAGRCTGRDERRRGALLETESGLCEACAKHCHSSLLGLSRDVAALTENIGGAPARAYVTTSRRPPDASIPLRLGVLTLREAIVFEVEYWAEVVGMESLTGVREQHRVATAVAWLDPRFDDLLAVGLQERSAWSPLGEALRDVAGDRLTVASDGVSAALQFADLRRWVRVILGRTRLVHRLPMPCSRCGHRALVREDGAEQVDCEHCGDRVPEDRYRWLCRVAVDVLQRRQG